MKYNKTLILIPMINGYRITKDGKVYKTDSELTEIEEVKPYFKKYKKVKLDGISYRVDELLMKTFIGEIDLPIQYKLDDKSICELDNLEYVIDIVEQVDENTLYINNVANEFKRIPGNNIFVTKNGLPTSFDKKRNFIYKDERITA